MWNFIYVKKSEKVISLQIFPKNKQIIVFTFFKFTMYKFHDTNLPVKPTTKKIRLIVQCVLKIFSH